MQPFLLNYPNSMAERHFLIFERWRTAETGQVLETWCEAEPVLSAPFTNGWSVNLIGSCKKRVANDNGNGSWLTPLKLLRLFLLPYLEFVFGDEGT